jgi:hypothetical protein
LVSRLLSLQSNETAYEVWRTAANTISEAFLRMSKTVEPPAPGQLVLDGLGGWLWRDFRKTSRVLRVADPERLRRDEDAVIEIARFLPLEYLTEFTSVDPASGFTPLLADFDAVEALCFVGRLCLYGEDAVKTWCVTKRTPRFLFGMDFRPDGLAQGVLHPQYHSVVLNAGEADPEPLYRTTQTDHSRTDYGVIRRYVVDWGGRCRVVIHIAGCSSLGTLGAAHFAACTLCKHGASGKPLPLPPQVDEQSHLEALVEVTADTRCSELGWRLRKLQLLDLRMDGFVWDEDEYSWQVPTPDVITVVFADAETRRASWTNEAERDETKVEILVDGQKVPFRGRSENRRLCIALCILASKQNGQVQLSQLGEDTWIWNDRAPKKTAYVKTRLSNLQRHLGNSLVVEHDTCRVSPKILLRTRKPT